MSKGNLGNRSAERKSGNTFTCSLQVLWIELPEEQGDSQDCSQLVWEGFFPTTFGDACFSVGPSPPSLRWSKCFWRAKIYFCWRLGRYVEKDLDLTQGQSKAPFTTRIQLQVPLASLIHISDGIPTDVHDRRFKATFEDVYTHPSLQTPWYLVAGNHDHRGNITAQIEYSKHSPRWKFPARSYTKTWTIPGTTKTVEIVFFDTWEFVEKPNSKIAEWMDTTLNASTADWLFVVGHYPVWSVGNHGPTQSIVKKLLPMFQRSKVSAYFCGHDHNLQHFQTEGIDYFVTGAGHSSDNSHDHANKVPKDSLRFFWPSKSEGLCLWSLTTDIGHHGGFITVSVTADVLKVDYLDDRGRMMYSTTRHNKRA